MSEFSTFGFTGELANDAEVEKYVNEFIATNKQLKKEITDIHEGKEAEAEFFKRQAEPITKELVSTSDKLSDIIQISASAVNEVLNNMNDNLANVLGQQLNALMAGLRQTADNHQDILEAMKDLYTEANLSRQDQAILLSHIKAMNKRGRKLLSEFGEFKEDNVAFQREQVAYLKEISDAIALLEKNGVDVDTFRDGIEQLSLNLKRNHEDAIDYAKSQEQIQEDIRQKLTQMKEALGNNPDPADKAKIDELERNLKLMTELGEKWSEALELEKGKSAELEKQLTETQQEAEELGELATKALEAEQGKTEEARAELEAQKNKPLEKLMSGMAKTFENVYGEEEGLNLTQTVLGALPEKALEQILESEDTQKNKIRSVFYQLRTPRMLDFMLDSDLLVGLKGNKISGRQGKYKVGRRAVIPYMEDNMFKLHPDVEIDFTPEEFSYFMFPAKISGAPSRLLQQKFIDAVDEVARITKGEGAKGGLRGDFKRVKVPFNELMKTITKPTKPIKQSISKQSIPKPVFGVGADELRNIKESVNIAPAIPKPVIGVGADELRNIIRDELKNITGGLSIVEKPKIAVDPAPEVEGGADSISGSIGLGNGYPTVERILKKKALFIDPNNAGALINRLGLLSGLFEGGNRRNSDIINEISAIADQLLNLGVINPEAHRVIFNKYIKF